jgi:hypothetical protein
LPTRYVCVLRFFCILHAYILPLDLSGLEIGSKVTCHPER